MYTPSRIVLLLAATLALVLCGSATGLAAAPPRLLSSYGTAFRVRPATIIQGMVLITGPNVTPQGFRRGVRGHIRWSRWTRSEARGRGRAWVPRTTGRVLADIRAWRVQGGRYTRLWWAYSYRGRRHQEWVNLIRLGGTWTWRVTRFT